MLRLFKNLKSINIGHVGKRRNDKRERQAEKIGNDETERPAEKMGNDETERPAEKKTPKPIPRSLRFAEAAQA